MFEHSYECPFDCLFVGFQRNKKRLFTIEFFKRWKMNNRLIRIFMMIIIPNDTNLIVYLLDFKEIQKDYLQLNFSNDEKWIIVR